MFDMEEYIIAVYCLIDDQIKALPCCRHTRRRGFAPGLSESEVITIEVVGEFLGLDTDSGIWRYFRQHWLALFPGLQGRTTFVRQAANLWYWKQQVQLALQERLGDVDSGLYLVDSFPMPVCRFKRSRCCQRFWAEASYGHSTTLGIYYGLRGHVLIDGAGLIRRFCVTSARVKDLDALDDLLDGITGTLVADKAYLSEPVAHALAQRHITLVTPTRSNMHTYNRLYNRLVSRYRQRNETVIGQLAERFHAERVWARDCWHLTNRMARKVLAHSIGVWFNELYGRNSLQFSTLITA